METKISKANALIILQNFMKQMYFCSKLGEIAGDCGDMEPDFCPMVDALFNSNMDNLGENRREQYYDLMFLISEIEGHNFKYKAEILYTFLSDFTKKDFNQK